MRNTNDFIVFYHVVSLGSFSGAAKQLGLAKSVVSKNIARLEEEVGAQLLYRTTRKVTLTEAGSFFFENAKNVFDAVERAEGEINGLGKKLSGKIRISVPSISGELILPSAISEFNDRFPDIHVDMELDNRFIDIVEEGFDLAIRTGVLPDSSFKARKLVDAKWVVCAAPKYIAKFGFPKSPEELIKHNCLTYSYQETGARGWLFKKGNDSYKVNVDGNVCCNNSSVLRSLALLGKGIIYVPKVLVYNDLQSGNLIEMLKDETAKCLGIYAIYPYTRSQPEKIRVFIEHLYRSFQSRKNEF